MFPSIFEINGIQFVGICVSILDFISTEYYKFQQAGRCEKVYNAQMKLFINVYKLQSMNAVILKSGRN